MWKSSKSMNMFASHCIWNNLFPVTKRELVSLKFLQLKRRRRPQDSGGSSSRDTVSAPQDVLHPTVTPTPTMRADVWLLTVQQVTMMSMEKKQLQYELNLERGNGAIRNSGEISKLWFYIRKRHQSFFYLSLTIVLIQPIKVSITNYKGYRRDRICEYQDWIAAWNCGTTFTKTKYQVGFCPICNK